MSDERIDQFRERAAAGVQLPDLDALARRGAALRRRRVAGAAVSSVAAAAAVGFVAFQWQGGNDSAGPDPTERPTSPAPRLIYEGMPRHADAPLYDEFELSTGATVRLTFTFPTDQWLVHIGQPQRGLNIGTADEYSGLLWYEARAVRHKPCGGEASDSAVALTDSLQPLVDMPYTKAVVSQPAADTLGGRDAQHTVLVLKGCKGDLPEPIMTGAGSGPMPGGREFDLWLVPLPEADTAIVVFDPAGKVSDDVRRQWDQVVDSLRITVEPVD